MATHSSILAWEIPWAKESGDLQSMGLQELDMTQQLSHYHINIPHYQTPRDLDQGIPGRGKK